jgi:hypothetical protein
MTTEPTLSLPHPQVKICGLTRPGEAAACADLGADAVGLVFFPKSPRNVTPDQASAVVAALPASVAAVGVFVNAGFSFIMSRVERCGLSMAQLHGREPPDLAVRLKAEGVGVIKALFVDGRPGLADAQGHSTSMAIWWNVPGAHFPAATPLPGTGGRPGILGAGIPWCLPAACRRKTSTMPSLPVCRRRLTSVQVWRHHRDARMQARWPG